MYRAVENKTLGMPVPYFFVELPTMFFVRCPGLFLTFGPRVWRLMFFCSPAQRKCRHWYIKLIYFCYLPRLVECSPQIIYDIGTKILYFQCFVTTDMFLFCKPIIFSGNCRICRDHIHLPNTRQMAIRARGYLKISLKYNINWLKYD